MAQPPTMEAVKTNPVYLWGESINTDREEARRQAETNLLSKIQVSLHTSFTEILEEQSTESGTEQYTKTRSTISAFTGMYLQGLQRFYAKSQQQWTVLAYIHQDSLQTSFAQRAQKIQDYTEQGLARLADQHVGPALKNFYWAYLLARAYPKTLTFPGTESHIKVNAHVTLQSRIQTILRTIEVAPGLCYQDGQMIIAPLQFHYHKKPVKELLFSYYGGMGTEYAIVDGGTIDIPLYDTPTSHRRKLTLHLEYTYANEMSLDPEVHALHTVFGPCDFRNLRTVEIAFPWIPPSATHSPLPEPQTEAIAALYAHRYDLRHFLNMLQQYQQLGMLTFGASKDFAELQGCYAAVADQETVRDIFYYNGHQYTAIQSHRSYVSLSPQFQGKRIIWIRETAE